MKSDTKLIRSLERLILEGHQVSAAAERQRIVAVIERLAVVDAHDPEALYAANNQAVYLQLLNQGIAAGYRAAVRAIEQKEKTIMISEELRVLCNLLMVSDPWPLSKADEMILKNFADEEAKRHGYQDWIEAYHEIGPVSEGEPDLQREREAQV